MKTALRGKPVRAIMSSFSTFRHSPKASLPFKLKMECSAICNLRCKMCPLSVGLKRTQGVLKFENFKNVFDQINPAYLNLTGIGEPFMNPDLFKIVKYAKSKKCMVKLDTNGTLVNQKNVKKILETNIDIISTSIDGVDKKSYEKIRVNSDFNLVRNNIKNLINERNKINSKTQVHMFFVLQEENIGDLPKFINMAEDCGVDYLAGSYVVTLGENQNKKNKIFNYKKDIKTLVKETRQLIKKVNFEVGVGHLLEYLESGRNKKYYNKNRPCYMPWYATFITWDGWVNPCDFSCDNEIVFGNAFKELFKDIWNNDKIQKFRIAVLKNRDKVQLCRGCSVDETYIENEFLKMRKIPFIKFLEYWK